MDSKTSGDRLTGGAEIVTLSLQIHYSHFLVC